RGAVLALEQRFNFATQFVVRTAQLCNRGRTPLGRARQDRAVDLRHFPPAFRRHGFSPAFQFRINVNGKLSALSSGTRNRGPSRSTSQGASDGVQPVAPDTLNSVFGVPNNRNVGVVVTSASITRPSCLT